MLQVLPYHLLLIFPKKLLILNKLLKKSPLHCMGLITVVGRFDIFEQWFTHHTPAGRPLLLLIDGLSRHYNQSFNTKAAHEKVILFCLPPNTTHLLQPLDKSAFVPLMTFWNEECRFKHWQIN